MPHKWITTSASIFSSAQRTCEHCNAIQRRLSEHTDRLQKPRYSWQPLVGKCKRSTIEQRAEHTMRTQDAYDTGRAAGREQGLIDGIKQGDRECWDQLIDREACAELWNVNGQRARVHLQNINKRHGDAVCKIIGTSWVIRRSDAEKYRPARVGGRKPVALAQLEGTIVE